MGLLKLAVALSFAYAGGCYEPELVDCTITCTAAIRDSYQRASAAAYLNAGTDTSEKSMGARMRAISIMRIT